MKICRIFIFFWCEHKSFKTNFLFPGRMVYKFWNFRIVELGFSRTSWKKNKFSKECVSVAGSRSVCSCAVMFVGKKKWVRTNISVIAYSSAGLFSMYSSLTGRSCKIFVKNNESFCNGNRPKYQWPRSQFFSKNFLTFSMNFLLNNQSKKFCFVEHTLLIKYQFFYQLDSVGFWAGYGFQ